MQTANIHVGCRPNAFLHFYNDLVLQNHHLHCRDLTIVPALMQATRLAALVTPEFLYISAADLIQSDVLRACLPHLSPLLRSQALLFVGFEGTPEGLLARKEEHYRRVKLYGYGDSQLQRVIFDCADNLTANDDLQRSILLPAGSAASTECFTVSPQMWPWMHSGDRCLNSPEEIISSRIS